MKQLLLVATVATLGLSQALAGGYQVNLQGQKNIGMGHTGTGLALDHAAIFFNPGALSHIRQNGLQLGASAIISRTAYLQEATLVTAKTDNPVGTPLQIYGSYGTENSPLKFGLGIYTPYGSSVKWETGWVGEDALREIDLSAIFIQPTVSWKLTEWLGVGAGFVYARGSVNLQRRFPRATTAGTFGNIELDGNGEGMGFNAGVYAKPHEKFSVGLTYRSKVDMKVEGGDLTFTGVPTALQSSFQNTRFSATLPLPDNITLGIGFMPSDKLTLAADIQRVGWAAYKSLRFDYGRPVGNPAATFSESARNYKDAYIYRLGGQYMVTEDLALRMGGYYDKTPVSKGYVTAETPDADAIGLTVGVGYSIGQHLQLDASFLYIDKKERTDLSDLAMSQGGTYKTKAAIPGLSITYNFNARELPHEPTSY